MAVKSVVIFQDANNELNSKVFGWALNGFSLKPGDKLTLVAILHKVNTPMGYEISVAEANQRIVEAQVVRKKEEYQNNEELAQISKLYEAQEVGFKIKLVTESSPREIALKAARNLSATWVVLDRQMKKDEAYFFQNLSCGISRLKCDNKIVCLRLPLDLPIEIQLSHETYESESTPENGDNLISYYEVFPESPRKPFDLSQEPGQSPTTCPNPVSRPYEPKKEGSSTVTTNSNKTTGQTNPDHLSMDEKGTHGNQMIGQINGDQQCKDQKLTSRNPTEGESDPTLVINTNQAAQEISEQLSQDKDKRQNFFHDEERGFRHPKNSENMIAQPNDDLLIQNQEHTESDSHGDLLDGKKEKSILDNSRCSICSVCKNKRPNVEWQKDFTYEELQAATDGFSEKNCLSEGGHGSTFGGQLEGELKIVVKEHEIIKSPIAGSVLQSILKARHENVVMLLGSTIQCGSLWTVYEYACNSSLDKYLSKESSRPLSWTERVKVAVGIARGLKYLHENNIIHGNIKPSNILLTHDFKPLIGDFGLGKNLEMKKSYKNKNIGYMAPEYQEKGKPSTKTDIYSFGVVLLELISGRRATNKVSGEKSLVEWAKPLLGGKKYPQLVDPKISSSYEEDQLLCLLRTTEQCLKKNPKDRFSMNMIVSALQGIADSEECYQIADFSQTMQYSRCIGPNIAGSQGQTEADQPSLEHEQIESSTYREEKSFRVSAETNHMIGQGKADQLSQIKDKMQCRPQGEGRDSGKMIINNHEMKHALVDQLHENEEQKKKTLYEERNSRQALSKNHMISQRKVDQLSQDEKKQSSFISKGIGLTSKPICKMIGQTKPDQLIQDKTQLQSSSHENLLDGHQGEIILENSKYFGCSICKRKRTNIVWPKDFTLDEVLAATDGFSIKNSLSKGQDGPTFKGLLEGKLTIVVKKFQITSSHEEKIFKSEVQLLTKTRHQNVIMLVGLCIEKSQLMIVYEQACNGSLDHHLSRENFQPLNWRERVKVAVGVARGLKYLHENNIIHGSIKPSNILLTHDFKPLLGDFGFGKVKPEPKKSYKDKNVGYTAPEYLESGKLSSKTDVYSLGVVLLELITGQRAADKLSGGKSLVGWARPLLGGKKYAQLVDPKVSDSYEEDQLSWLVQVTEQCLRKNPKDRLTMNMVVSALQGIADTDECCAIDNLSPEKPYLPHSEPVMTSSEGQTKADQVSHEQEQIESNQYKEDMSLRLTIKNDQNIGQRKADKLRQDGGQMQTSLHGEERRSMVMSINSHMIDQINTYQLSQEKEHIEGSFPIEEIGKKACQKQMLSQHQNQIQNSSSSGDLRDAYKCKAILENSKSSVCSICKSRRPNNGWQKKFTYEELQAATDGFSIKNSLTEGKHRPAFRGQLDCKLKIVVKQHEITSSQAEKTFESELQSLTNARHENVVMLLGSCIEKNQLLIVYEHACNGSLDQHLSRGSGRSMTWGERVKVARGVSRGLKYLHENNIIHGRIKPSNILLNHEFEPLLGDFGFGKEMKICCNNKNMLNWGYTAPEFHESGKLSTKTDVYSFGAVLLELITGYRINDKISGNKCLIEWARPHLQGRNYPQLVDPKICSSYDEQELVSLVQVTEMCLRKNPKERLTMNMVVSALPCVVDSNDSYVTKDFNPEKPYLAFSVSDVTSSKDDEESLAEEDLGSKVSQEREDDITCSRSHSETKIIQEKDISIIRDKSKKETEEKESLSTKVCQKGDRCISYGRARSFFLGGPEEYKVCEHFFSLAKCDSF